MINEYGIKPSNALHVAVMKTHSISNIALEDKELDKIKDIKRMWLE